MQLSTYKHLFAVFFSLALHTLVFSLASNMQFGFAKKPAKPKAEPTVLFLALLPPEKSTPKPDRPAAPIKAAPAVAPAIQAPPEQAVAQRQRQKNWKQVRSLMGTSVEGPDQGLVRFRLEIAADGTLTKLETLWTTSPVAEQLARNTIEKRLLDLWTSKKTAR
jgi:hypothetical protein